MARLGDSIAADMMVTCPRCSNEALQRFYGPCSTCATALRESFRGLAREVESQAYEPKMNVTPNAVATKD